jgi:hypothetical protein
VLWVPEREALKKHDQGAARPHLAIDLQHLHGEGKCINVRKKNSYSSRTS